MGDGAWFSLDGMRLGMAAGDFNGDGRDDVVYHGRCGRSVRCWRIHLSGGTALGTAQDWGDGARFAPTARSLISGDWNGDGFDDIVYQGLCGSGPVGCWRAHVNTDGLLVAEDWGPLPGGAVPVEMSSADLNGDGRDDLLYSSPCGTGDCWYGQMSTGKSFASPTDLGPSRPEAMVLNELFDTDGDGHADVVTVGEALDEYNLRHRAGVTGWPR
jgi:hypothetical protein